MSAGEPLFPDDPFPRQSNPSRGARTRFTLRPPKEVRKTHLECVLTTTKKTKRHHFNLRGLRHPDR